MAEPAVGQRAGSREGGRFEPLAEVRTAIAFLTRVPVRRHPEDGDRTGAAAFATVGTATGAVAAIPLVLLGASLPVAAAVLAVMVLAAISGGLHLDGLSDTADALAAPSPDAAARARSDPRAGPAGVAWVVLVLLLDVSLLAAIAAVDVVLAVAGLVAASASSRAAPVVAAWLAGRSRARAAGSLGTWFSDRVHARDLVFALVTAAAAIALCAAAARDLRMITGAVVGIGVAGAASIAVVLRRGQLDGDGFGAIVELTFASIVAGVAVAAVGP